MISTIIFGAPEAASAESGDDTLRFGNQILTAFAACGFKLPVPGTGQYYERGRGWLVFDVPTVDPGTTALVSREQDRPLEPVALGRLAEMPLVTVQTLSPPERVTVEKDIVVSVSVHNDWERTRQFLEGVQRGGQARPLATRVPAGQSGKVGGKGPSYDGEEEIRVVADLSGDDRSLPFLSSRPLPTLPANCTRHALVHAAPNAVVNRRIEVHPGRDAVIDFDPSLTFECVDDCTWCCHHGVLLYEKDLLELAARESLAKAVDQFRGRDFIQQEEKPPDHPHAGQDGQACYFLREDGLCSLHAEHDWKPARCSVFPLEVHVEQGDIHVTVREEAHEHCDGLNVSERRVIDHLDAFLPKLLWDLRDPKTKVEL